MPCANATRLWVERERAAKLKGYRSGRSWCLLERWSNVLILCYSSSIPIPIPIPISDNTSTNFNHWSWFHLFVWFRLFLLMYVPLSKQAIRLFEVCGISICAWKTRHSALRHVTQPWGMRRRGLTALQHEKERFNVWCGVTFSLEDCDLLPSISELCSRLQLFAPKSPRAKDICRSCATQLRSKRIRWMKDSSTRVLFQWPSSRSAELVLAVNLMICPWVILCPFVCTFSTSFFLLSLSNWQCLISYLED